MLKKLLNEAYFTLRITTTGPLLVKSGHASVSGPDMTPVLTFRNSCGKRFTDLAKDDDKRNMLEARTDFVYAESCPACRLFGSTWFIGRVAIGDAYLVTPPILEQRDGVGIDRLTGGASHGAKFELEVVSADVAFETNIHVRNFEIWQLGMLF